MSGILTSPNHPDNYPNSMEKTEIIQVEQGLIILLRFITFDIEAHPVCDYDNLKITDGDGKVLMPKSCGSSSSGNVMVGDQRLGTSLPANITSTSNYVKLVFRTDKDTSTTGWSISWRAVDPGKCKSAKISEQSVQFK